MPQYDYDEQGNVVGGYVDTPDGGSVYVQADDPDPTMRSALAQSLQLSAGQEAQGGTSEIPSVAVSQAGQMGAQAQEQLYRQNTPVWQQVADEENSRPIVTQYAGRPGVSPRAMGAAPGDIVQVGPTPSPYDPGYVPTGRAVAVQRGLPIPEGYVEDLQDQTIAQKMQIQAEQDQQTAEAVKAAFYARKQTEEANRAMAEQREEQRQIAARVAQKEEEYDALRRSVRDGRIDPRRVFSGVGGTIAGIGAAIAQAMGAWAATMSGSPNFAQQIIDGAIQDDIRAQERELDDRGRSANNALGQLERLYGDRDQAKARLEVIQRDAANMQLRQLAAESGIPQIQLEADRRIQEAENVLSEKLAGLQQASMDRETVQYQAAFVQGQRPVSGGVSVRQPTAMEKLRNAAEARKLAGEAGYSLTPEQEEARWKAEAEARATIGTEDRKLATEGAKEYGKAMAEYAPFVDAVQELGTLSGGTRKADGKWSWDTSVDIPGAGAIQRSIGINPDSVFRREESDLYNQTLARAVQSFAKFMSGAGMPESEVIRYTEMVSGAGSEEERRHGIEMLTSIAERTKKNLQGAYGVPAVQLHESNMEAFAERARKREAAKGASGYTPYRIRQEGQE